MEPDDLLIQILLCLPLHSVTRFESTCKQWRSLITNPAFRETWCHRNFKPSTGLIVRCNYASYVDRKDRRYPVSFVPFSLSTNTTIPTLDRKLIIVASCNGLLLCSSRSWYNVYNPTTNMSSNLPKLADETMSNRSMSLAFDPNKSPYYKVVCFTSVNNGSLTYNVYSSDARIWTLIEKPVKSLGYLDPGVYWNGSIYWLYSWKYFNIENQTVKVIRAPPLPETSNYYYGVSCDRLNCTKFSKSESCITIDVCESKRDYSEWVLKYHVDLDQYIGPNMSVISVVYGLERDDSFLVLKKGDIFIRYNLVSKTLEELNVSLPGRFIDSAFQHIESLCDV